MPASRARNGRTLNSSCLPMASLDSAPLGALQHLQQQMAAPRAVYLGVLLSAVGMAAVTSSYWILLLESVTLYIGRAPLVVILMGISLGPAAAALGRGGKAVAGSTHSTSGPGAASLHSLKSHSIPVTVPAARGSGLGNSRVASSASPGKAVSLLRRLRFTFNAVRRDVCNATAMRPAVEVPFSRRGSLNGSQRTTSCSSQSSSSRPSVRPSPLSRLSIGLQALRSRRDSPSVAATSFMQKAAQRWQPAMVRIASAVEMATEGTMASVSGSTASSARSKEDKSLEVLSYNGYQAVDCLGFDLTDRAVGDIKEVIVDQHLLHFGALVGEASAQLALTQAETSAAAPVGPDPASFFGDIDDQAAWQSGWELAAHEHSPGLHFWAWRRHLRKGLYVYKTRAVYERATTQQLAAFVFDNAYRMQWDDSALIVHAMAPPRTEGLTPCNSVSSASTTAAAPSDVSDSCAAAELAAFRRSSWMYAKSRFPPPMATREYVYARRVWAKPDDGGCYCLSRAASHPNPPASNGRVVRVEDYASGFVIRATRGMQDDSCPAAEVVSVYFEDPHVRAGIANLGIRKGLWPVSQKNEAAFRRYVGSPAALAQQQRQLEHQQQQQLQHEAVVPAPAAATDVIQEPSSSDGRGGASQIGEAIAEPIAVQPARLSQLGSHPLRQVDVSAALAEACVGGCGPAFAAFPNSHRPKVMAAAYSFYVSVWQHADVSRLAVQHLAVAAVAGSQGCLSAYAAQGHACAYAAAKACSAAVLQVLQQLLCLEAICFTSLKAGVVLASRLGAAVVVGCECGFLVARQGVHNLQPLLQALREHREVHSPSAPGSSSGGNSAGCGKLVSYPIRKGRVDKAMARCAAQCSSGCSGTQGVGNGDVYWAGGKRASGRRLLRRCRALVGVAVKMAGAGLLHARSVVSESNSKAMPC